MKSDELTSGDMSSDGPQNSNVTAMSRALPPRCLSSSQVHQESVVLDLDIMVEVHINIKE